MPVPSRSIDKMRRDETCRRHKRCRHPSSERHKRSQEPGFGKPPPPTNTHPPEPPPPTKQSGFIGQSPERQTRTTWRTKCPPIIPLLRPEEHRRGLIPKCSRSTIINGALQISISITNLTGPCSGSRWRRVGKVRYGVPIGQNVSAFAKAHNCLLGVTTGFGATLPFDKSEPATAETCSNTDGCATIGSLVQPTIITATVIQTHRGYRIYLPKEV